MSTTEKSHSGKWQHFLKLLNVENQYRRKARLTPAILTLAPLIPFAAMVGIHLDQWLIGAAAGGGTVVLAGCVVWLSHLASAAGNRIQKRLYPRWPFDSPTNTRLHPNDQASSKQQKQIWYSALLRLTGIDINSVANDPNEAERAVNDAVVRLRTSVFDGNPLASRMDGFNIDYGFARNMAGLRPVWLLVAFASCAGCWIAYAVRQDALAIPVFSSLVLLAAVLASCVIVGYVKQTAIHYADSFFGLLVDCDTAKSKSQKKSSNVVQPPIPTNTGEQSNAN